MDLLAGYGSGSESDDSEQPALLQASPHPPAAVAVASTASALSSLPVPASQRAPLFSGLPKASTARRRRPVAKFSCGIDYGDLPKEVEEDGDGPAAKRRKQSGKGASSSLADFLPAPTRELGRRAAASSSKADPNRSKAFGSKFGDDDDDDDIVPGAEDPAGMFLGRGDGGEGEGELLAAPSGGGTHHQQQHHQQQQQQSSGYVRGVHDGQEYLYDPSTGQYFYPEAAGAASVPQQQSALEAALASEGGPAGITFKEVSGAALRHMEPAQRAERNALRSAFGDDYESRLKADAAKVGAVSKTAKRRHQLSSLYVQAKEQELEDMEKHTKGAKTKAETHRKYGW